MAQANEITTWRVYSRLARKLRRPGVLRALLESRRLDETTAGSLGQCLAETAARWPDRTAIKYEDVAYTWKEFNAATNRWAHTFARLGVGRGDVVLVDIVNRPEALLASMAALKLGAIAALLNTSIRGESLWRSIELVAPKAIVVGQEQFESVATLPLDELTRTLIWCRDGGRGSSPAGWLDIDAESRGASEEDPPVTSQVLLGDAALYVYTSGTTGLPKAAVTKHRKLRLGGLSFGKVILEMGPDDTFYSALPLYHSTGFAAGWGACVHTGAALAIGRRFSASSFWDEIRRHRATTFGYVGEILSYLLNQPPNEGDRRHQVRAIVGAGLRPEVWDEFKERFGIGNVCELYGASEGPNGFINILNFDKTIGWNPVGWKTVAWDAERDEPVRGADGFLREVRGQPGLLVMKLGKHQMFDGYTEADATEAKIIRDAFALGDAWFNSGDLLLSLGHGHARFVDRTGDTFRWRGENVATTEVEGIAGSWPQVEQAVVYGVEVPGTEGRCGMVLVVLAAGQEELDTEGFASFLRRHLPAYAVPRFLRVAADVEVTGSFKFKKVSLRDDGFDPRKVDDPIHILAVDDSAFRPLDERVFAAIERGEVRL